MSLLADTDNKRPNCEIIIVTWCCKLFSMYMSGCRCTRFVGMCWCVLVCVGVGITHSETKDKVRQIKALVEEFMKEIILTFCFSCFQTRWNTMVYTLIDIVYIDPFVRRNNVCQCLNSIFLNSKQIAFSSVLFLSVTFPADICANPH